MEFTQTTTTNADGSTTTHFNAVVLIENTSKALKSDEMNDLMLAITGEMENIFTKYDPEKNIYYEITVTLSVLPEGEKIGEGQFGVRFVDTSKERGTETMKGGHAIRGDWESQIFEVAVAMRDDYGRLHRFDNSLIAGSFAHEMGHTGGLPHPYVGNGGNSLQNFYKVNETPQDVHDPYLLAVGFLKHVNSGKNCYDYYMDNKDNLSPFELNNLMMQGNARGLMIAAWNNCAKDAEEYAKSHHFAPINVPRATDHLHYHLTTGQLQLIANTVGKK